MTRVLTAPLTPFVDALPLPRRVIARKHRGRVKVRMRTATHRFHRDLPESRIWGFDGTVPGPTIEAERGQPVTVEWRNEIDASLPVGRHNRPRGDGRRRRAGAVRAGTEWRCARRPGGGAGRSYG